jgi:hypothetical protein
MEMENFKNASRRDDFLLAMYNQMWGNINRHILVIWQSVAALLGAFAVLSLTANHVLPVDLACSLIVVLCAWVGAHVIDANFWFARNIHIIANIERQFLWSTDLQNIHPYFRDLRKPTMLDHLTVQGYLALSVFVLITAWHFVTRVMPGLKLPLCDFSFAIALPYIVMLVSASLLLAFAKKQIKSNEDLLQKSPGLLLDPKYEPLGGAESEGG